MNNPNNPSLGARARDNGVKLWNLTWNQYLALDGAVWKTILIACVATIAMFFFNKSDMREMVWVMLFIGYLLIWWFGMRPTNVLASTFVGGLVSFFRDEDVTRGMATGPLVLFGVVRNVAYSFLLLAFTLGTWDFSVHPESFWVALAAVLILTQNGNFGGIRRLLITGYVVIVLILSLTGMSNWIGVYSGRAFDPDTGQSTRMVDSLTGEIDSEGRTPEFCNKRPNGCFSVETGNPLHPMNKEEADRYNLSFSDMSLGGSGPATASGNCTKGNPCVVYDGYVLHLTPNTPLVTNQAKAFWKTGMDVKVCNPKLRATMHDSELFNNEQPPNSNIVTVAPVASGFAKAGVPSIELRIYPRGEGDERIKRDCGVYTPPINLKPQ